MLASAEDHYVCKPAPGGTWTCTAGGVPMVPHGTSNEAPPPSGDAPAPTPDGTAESRPDAAPENAAPQAPPANGVDDSQAPPSNAVDDSQAPPADAVDDSQAPPSDAVDNPQAAAAPAVVADPANLDWVPRATLPSALQSALPRYCSGAYFEPAFPYPLTAKREDFPVAGQGATAEYVIGDRGTLSGAVRITQGNLSLAADRASFEQSSQTLQADGHVVIQEPGFLALGEHAQYDVANGAATVTSAQFVMHPDDYRGSAATLVRDESGNVRIEHGRFTRCEPGNDSWTLSSTTITVDDGAKFGIAHDAVLRAGPVPILYTPYIRFPVSDDRLTGFLFPDLAYNNTGGVDLTLPYYLNLAPNYDATFTPRYIAKRGSGAELEVRDLTSWGKTQVGGAFLSHDDLYNGEVSRDDFQREDLPGRFHPADRWLVSADHKGYFDGFSTLVDYTQTSDRDYLRDLGTDLSSASNVALDQRGEIRYANDGLLLRLWAQAFQNLDNDTADSYRRLPEIDALYRGRLLGPFYFSLATSAADFYRNNDDLLGIDRINGRRFHVEPRLELPFDAAAGFVRLTAGYRYTRYDLADVPVGEDDAPDRKIGFGSADAGLYFERESSLLGAGTTQTLEPRVFYLYQQNEDQSKLPTFDATDLTFTYDQLFRDNRFAGLDRIGDANQLSTGVTTRLIESDGMERMRASLGQIFYFRDRDVTVAGPPAPDANQTTSSFAGQAGLALSKTWSLRSDALWDPHDGQFRQIGARLQFLGPSRGVFNVGYRSLGDEDGDLDQFETSVYWPLLSHFAVLGRWYYDVKKNEDVELFGGIEYESCCWQIRLVGRRFISEPGSANVDHVQSDSAVLVQIVLKGLAGIGGRIESLMEHGIRGYVPEDLEP